jgi:hypothetical protein
VVFEPTIPASERAKTVHAADRSATMTGEEVPSQNKIGNLDFIHFLWLKLTCSDGSEMF